MKKILLTIAICCSMLNATAQDVDYYTHENGVLKLGNKVSSSNSLGSLGTAIYAIHYIELYTDGETSEYILRVDLESGLGFPYLFPADARMLMKVNKETLELVPIFHCHHEYSDSSHPLLMGMPVFKSQAFYRLPKEQLESICQQGSTKIRIEILAYNNKDGIHMTHRDMQLNTKNIKKFVDESSKNTEAAFNRINYKQPERKDISKKF